MKWIVLYWLLTRNDDQSVVPDNPDSIIHHPMAAVIGVALGMGLYFIVMAALTRKP